MCERYDAAKGIVWSVGKDANFNPLVEKPHGLSRVQINFDRYAVRLDGKPQELRKAKWTGGKDGSASW